MALTGGADRSDLEALDDGLIPLTGEASPRGPHVGHNANLNVPNPQPGFSYYHGRNPKFDRGGQHYRITSWGYEVVGPDSPEFKSQAANLRYSAMGLDSYHTHGDVVLYRIREERYRQFCKYRKDAAAAALGGPTESWLQAGSEVEARSGYRRADGPIYYRTPAHGFQESA